MTTDEVRVFAETPWARDAGALRRWDDAAKVPGLDVPGLSHYRSRIEQLVERR
jgi:gamma-butyrobetaine dioxygenase